jgi:hypothetical protein
MTQMQSNGKTLAAGIALAIIALSCSTVEPLCGCEPVVFSVQAVGTITDAGGAPVANAQYTMIGMSAGRTFAAPSTPQTWYPTTDANGQFVQVVYGSAETQEIHVAVYPPGRNVVTVSAGTANFKMTVAPVDTVKLAITLPP